jgi:hypothetical protein
MIADDFDAIRRRALEISPDSQVIVRDSQPPVSYPVPIFTGRCVYDYIHVSNSMERVVPTPPIIIQSMTISHQIAKITVSKFNEL